eukprot:TRINITY_DN171_c2_g1_i1.p1 TRINITY_DN171_c2_g1~~TRINITY_DN171_c2_g1_i1.p1  ORF type:complete len:149 (-),score=43.09 TRINITY_DN171_c2_g1_i1:34-480(-)
MLIFTFNQCYFWWLPYFFDIIKLERKIKFVEKIDGIIKILPPIGDHLVPSAEHTILQVLSQIALYFIVVTIIKSTTFGKKSMVFSVFLGLLLTTAVNFKTYYGDNEDIGSLIIFGVISGYLLVTGMIKIISSSSSEEEEEEDKMKKQK